MLLHNIVLHDNVYNTWRWLLDPIHGYSVRGSYRFLTSTVIWWTELWMMMSGINTFLPRCLFWRGACFAIDFLLKITWRTVVFFLQITRHVLTGVPQPNPQHIFFFIALSHESYGLMFGIG